MPVILHSRNFAHVPVLLWPLVFLRLWQLYWWTLHIQRDVLYTVTYEGQIIVHYIADDPADLNGWLYRRAQAPQPHIYPCFNAAGDLHLPDIVILTGMAMLRSGYFVRWVWVRVVARGVPAVIDTS